MNALALVEPDGRAHVVANGFSQLRQAVLNGMTAENSKKNYALALDELSAFSNDRQQPISRTFILAFRSAMLDRELSASTINVKMSAVRKLVNEAKRAGLLGAEEAAQMADVPNVRQQGLRLGNWLTRSNRKSCLLSRTAQASKASGTT